jgi:hypothetical protein
VQFEFSFSLNNDGGCDPGDTTTGHSDQFAALGNVSGHELVDPRELEQRSCQEQQRLRRHRRLHRIQQQPY